MKSKQKIKPKKAFSRNSFPKWLILTILIPTSIVLTIFITAVFTILKDWWKTPEKYSTLRHYVIPATVVVTILFVFYSLFILLSRKSTLDNRFNIMPIVLSPVYIFAVNGLLHLMTNMDSTNLYEVLTNALVGLTTIVVTFSSIKFGFGLSANRELEYRRNEKMPVFQIKLNNEKQRKTISSLKNEFYIVGFYKDEMLFPQRCSSYKVTFVLKEINFILEDNQNKSFINDTILVSGKKTFSWDLKEGYPYLIIKDTINNIYFIHTETHKIFYIPPLYFPKKIYYQMTNFHLQKEKKE